MASTQSITGLGSGLDVESIVSQLVALKRVPISKLGTDISIANTRKTGLQEVSNLLSSLRSAAAGLREASLWDTAAPATADPNVVQSVASSNPAVLGAVKTGASTVADTSVEVLNLARADQRQTSATFTKATAAHTLRIKVGSDPQVNVAIANNDTVATIASKINATANVGVTASVENGRLMISSQKTGAANAVTITSSNTTQLNNMGLTVAQSGADARYRINGGAVQTSSSNQITGIVTGVNATLGGVGTSILSVTETTKDGKAAVTQADKIADKVQAFVDAYNNVLRASNKKVTEKPIKDADTSAAKLTGALFGDSTLRTTMDTLRDWRFHEVQGQPAAYNSFADLGVQIQTAAGPDANLGILNFDRDKFKEAYAADPAAAHKLVDNVTANTSTEGLSQWAEKAIDKLINSGGIVASGIAGQDARVSSIQSRQDRLSERVTRYEAQLRRQFAQLDTVMARMNGQSSYLGGQLASFSS